MKYHYEAYNPDGSVSSGVIEATSREDAERQIRDDGMFPASVSTGKGTQTATKGKRKLVLQNRLRMLSGFTRQLSVLVASGTPLVDALAAVERQTPESAWRDALADVREHVERGESFAEAMSRHPKYFDAVYRSLISAGESGGDMLKILERLSAMSRQQMVVQSTITGAMMYPALLLVVAGSVLVGLFLKVLPRFEELFETLNAPLPPMTAMLIEASSLVREQGLWLGLGGALAIGGGVMFFRSASGQSAVQHAMIRLPLFGPVVRSFIIARFARVLGVMLEARVPLLESLAVSRASMKHALYAGLIERATLRVEKGEMLSDGLENPSLVPSSFVEAIRNGEQTGRVGEVLVIMADMMDEDNAILARSLTSILEPVILALLGVLVGAVALSLFLPLFDLTASTGAS